MDNHLTLGKGNRMIMVIFLRVKVSVSHSSPSFDLFYILNFYMRINLQKKAAHKV